MPAGGHGDRLVQPLVAEVADGETSMIAVEGRVTHAVRKVPAPGDFRVHVHHGGTEVGHDADRRPSWPWPMPPSTAVGEPLLYARVDCVTTAAGPRLMELELIEPSLFLGWPRLRLAASPGRGHAPARTPCGGRAGARVVGMAYRVRSSICSCCVGAAAALVLPDRGRGRAVRPGHRPGEVDRVAGLQARRAGPPREGRRVGLDADHRGSRPSATGWCASSRPRPTRPRWSGAYQRFLAVNQRLLDLCTRWQLRTVDGPRCPTTTPTTATTPRCWPSWTPSTGVAGPVCDELAAVARAVRPGTAPGWPRPGPGSRRGDTDWFTKPTIDSYHTVWFELHENLLATLGIERGQERPEASTPLQEAR